MSVSPFFTLFLLFFIQSLFGQEACFKMGDNRISNLEFPINSKEYLIEKGGGKVYDVYCDSLVRIDDSFSFRSRYGALNFVHQNYLYSFGGYGIFQFSNNLIRFYPVQNTWEIILPNTAFGAPQPRRFMIGGLFDSKMYVGPGTGEKYIKAEQKILDQIYKDLWVLNIDEMEWKELVFPQSIEEQLNRNTNKFNLSEFSMLTAKDLVLFNYKTEQFEIYADYKSTLFKEALAIEENDGLFTFYYGDNVSILVDKEEALGKVQEVIPFKYKTKINYNMYALIMSCIFAACYVWYRSRKTISFVDQLSPQQIQILHYIQQNEKVSYKSLYSLYDVNLSHETLKGKLRKDIEEIDDIFYKSFNKKLFTHHVDPYDKRIKIVSLGNNKIQLKK